MIRSYNEIFTDEKNMNNNHSLVPQEAIRNPLEMLYEWEQTRSDSVYLTQPISADEKRTYTWQQTAEAVRKLAAMLRAKNYPAGSRIAILSKNCAEWIITDLAIMMAGHVSVPIFSTAGQDTINYVLKHADCQLIFVGKLDDYARQVACLPEHIDKVGFPYAGIDIGTPWQQAIDIAPIEDSPVPDNNKTMTIIYTSGSTGQPKGVVHSYATICWAARNCLSSLQVDHSDRVMSYLPLAHITERVLVELASLYSAMSLHFVESLDTFTRDVKAFQPTLFISVPRLWTKFQLGILAKVPQRKLNILLKLPFVGKKVAAKIRTELGLDKTRLWASGSAPLAPAVITWFSKLGINISEGWGMTENSAYGTCCVPFRLDKVGAIGHAYEGVDIRIADDGEIQVKSPCNMLGYYSEPEKTAGVFTNDGYLRTGDKGEVDADGYFKITGRLKDIFKTEKGKYVTPAPIEAKLMENSYIEQVCVTGTNLPQPIALVVLSEEARSLDKQQVTESLNNTLAAVNENLESHQRLNHIVVFSEEWSIENDLLTPTLKVKRHIIEERFVDVIQQKQSAKVAWHH